MWGHTLHVLLNLDQKVILYVFCSMCAFINGVDIQCISILVGLCMVNGN